MNNPPTKTKADKEFIDFSVALDLIIFEIFENILHEQKQRFNMNAGKADLETINFYKKFTLDNKKREEELIQKRFDKLEIEDWENVPAKTKKIFFKKGRVIYARNYSNWTKIGKNRQIMFAKVAYLRFYYEEIIYKK